MSCKILTPDDEKYQKAVNIKSNSSYEIDLQALNPDEKIICPFDSDMSIQVTPDGSCCISKKSFMKPFIRQPEINESTRARSIKDSQK